jgi:ABC-type uncharacterized transport system permease subunit
MSLAVLNLGSAVVYAILGALAWRAPAVARHRAILLVVLAAWLVQGAALAQALWIEGQLFLGVGHSIAAFTWIAVATLGVVSLRDQASTLGMLVWPFAAVGCVAAEVWPGVHAIAGSDRPLLQGHLVAAMLAYAFFTLAGLQAWLMQWTEGRLHAGRVDGWVSQLPPVITQEQVLFRLIWSGFVLLSLNLVSGALFAEEIFDRALPFNHKTVLGITSWLIFGWLLLGRHIGGWRGRIAARMTITGCIVLLLAYIGARFVAEIMLGRVA